MYRKYSSEKEAKSSYTKSGNHGKKWTDEEEAEATQLFNNGTSIKAIARQLNRGENGVKIKLKDMGVMDGWGVYKCYLGNYIGIFLPEIFLSSLLLYLSIPMKRICLWLNYYKRLPGVEVTRLWILKRYKHI